MLGPPNFFLAMVPPNIDPHSLNTLVAFAVGGLLGDVFLHLLPQGSSPSFLFINIQCLWVKEMTEKCISLRYELIIGPFHPPGGEPQHCSRRCHLRRLRSIPDN